MQTAQAINSRTVTLKPISRAKKQELFTIMEVNEHISDAYWNGRADQALLSDDAKTTDLTQTMDEILGAEFTKYEHLILTTFH